MNQSPKKRSEPAKKIGGGSLPLATASSPRAAESSATPSNGGHPRNAPGKWETTTVGRNTQELTSLSQIGIFAPHWVEKSLLDVCVLVTDGTHDSPKPVKIGFPLVTGKAIKNREIDFSVTYNISESDHLKVIARSKPEIDDILFANIGNSIGDLVRVKSSHDFSIKNVALFKPNKFVINPRFLEYYLLSDQVQVFIKNTLKGSAQPFIGLASLRGLSVAIPPMLEQNVIASVLGSLDDKIALNRRINQTLEAMAQALFQSWFVDFDPVKAKQKILGAGGTAREAELAAMQIISGKNPHQLKTFQQTQPQQYAELEHTAKLFPNRLVESELGPVPEGWEVSSIGKEVQVLGGGTPSTGNPEFWENGTIHWTTPKDLSNQADKILLSTDRKITEQGLASITSQLMPIDTLLMSSRAPVGYLAMAKIPVAVNQGYIAMRCEKTLTPEFVIQWCSSVMDEIKQRASGTTFAEISKKVFGVIQVLLPNEQIIQAYSVSVKSIYASITNNAIQVQKLTETRDTLLPKLLSGEIDLTEFIEELP